MHAQTGKAVSIITALGIVFMPAQLMADGVASAGVKDMAVAQYAPGESMWCPEIDAAVPSELHGQMNCTTVATGFARDAVAGIRITNNRPWGLRDFFRSIFQPSNPRDRVSDDDNDTQRPRLVPINDGSPSPTSPTAPVDAPKPTSPEKGDNSPKPAPSGKERQKGDNGWGNGPDTTNAGSFSGGTVSSKSTNGKSRDDKNYSSSLDKFDGR